MEPFIYCHEMWHKSPLPILVQDTRLLALALTSIGRDFVGRLLVCTNLGLYAHKPKQSRICMSSLDGEKESAAVCEPQKSSGCSSRPAWREAAHSTAIEAAGQGTHCNCTPLTRELWERTHGAVCYWGSAILSLKSLAWFSTRFSGRKSAGGPNPTVCPRTQD